MGMKVEDAFAMALAAAQSYTDEEVAGGGAIKGKNCTIKSITSIEGGHRVTFEWTLDDGTVQTNTMNVMDGEDGAAGAKGDKGDKGNTGDTGAKGDKGDTGNAATIQVGTVISGESPSVVNGGTPENAIFNFVLPKGDKGDRGPTGANGKDGQDGKSFEIKARFATYEELIEAYPHGPENTGDAYFVGTTSNPDLYVWVTEDAEWVNNGPIAGVKGDKGDKGDTGDDGYSPIASVSKVGKIATITIRDKSGQTTSSVSDGEDGADGQDGADGEDGVGITSIDFKEKDVDGNNVYTVTLSNGDTYDFTAPKGDNGAGGAYFGTSNTSGSTATKVVTTTNGDFELFTGADIIVKFSYDDTAGACLLKVDGTTAKAIKQNGSDVEAGVLTADNVYEFVYTGTYFEMVSGGSSMAIEDIDQSDFTLANKQLSLQPSRRMFQGTKAEYEALSEAEKKKYDYLASPETVGGDFDVYSTTETKTNKVWIDGKSIYRKVIHYAGVATSGTSTLIGSITGFADIISIEGTLRNSTDDNCFPLGYTYSNFGSTVIQNMPFVIGNNGSVYANPYGFNISNINVTIEYTKTTD